MGKNISIQPVGRQVNKVVKHKSPRRNVPNSFRKEHKANEVKVKRDHIRELKQQMYNRLWGTEESAPKSQLDLIG